MAGREKKRVFVYDYKGKFIEWFESQRDFQKKYYKDAIGIVPLFVQSHRFKTSKGIVETIKYGFYKDVYFFENRIYRNDIVFLDKIHNSEFCKKTDVDSKPVEVFNLLGEKIAEFKSVRLLSKMCPNISRATINYCLNENGKNVKRHSSDLGLIFRYKLS